MEEELYIIKFEDKFYVYDYDNKKVKFITSCKDRGLAKKLDLDGAKQLCVEMSNLGYSNIKILNKKRKVVPYIIPN